MIEARGGLRFASKSGERFPRVGVKTQDALQRDDAEGMALPCPINHAHAAATDLFQDLVIANTPIRVVHLDLRKRGVQ